MRSLNKQMRDISLQAQGGQATHPDPLSDNPAQSTWSYPRAGLQSDTPERDQRMLTRRQLMNASGPGGVNTPFGLVTATDEDFEWLERKRKLEELANFDAWIGRNFHKGDVAARKWLQETMPEYYEQRERLAVERAKFALRVFLLKLRGPKNEKDLLLLWGLETGRITLDDGWDRIGYHPKDAKDEAGFKELQKRFAKNLFGPYRYLSQAERQANSTSANNPFYTSTGSAKTGQWDVGSQFPSFGPDSNALNNLTALFGRMNV